MNATTALTPVEAKACITEMAVIIRITQARNYLTFRTLFQAEQAADLFQAAGITCGWLGGNQPVLTTAAYFVPKS